MSQAHAPVMLSETLDAFRAAKSVRAAWDGTFGRGGHARATLDQFPDARLWAMDMDEAAIAHGREAFAREVAEGRAHFTRAPYVRFKELRAQFPEAFDAMLLDLGVSSPQLDEAERGFSFYHDGPLDMRMDRTQETTAATVINEWDEEDLARLFIELGEVPRPFRVVRAIAHDRKSRPFRTTLDLAGLIERVDGWRKKGSHPATKYFLALRLEVNAELRQLETALPDLVDALAPGGVLAVITFHSLEDRVVKYALKARLDEGRLLNKKALKASDAEIAANPRARSAKLRTFRKTHPDDANDIPQGAKGAWKARLR